MSISVLIKQPLQQVPQQPLYLFDANISGPVGVAGRHCHRTRVSQLRCGCGLVGRCTYGECGRLWISAFWMKMISP